MIDRSQSEPSARDESHPEGACLSGALELSVVVPVYRSATTLPELHRRLDHILERMGVSAEFVYVNDACPEWSLDVLRSLAEHDERVTVLALKRNVGQHRALLVGLAHARGNTVVFLDADLQDPPEAIPALLGKLREGYGAVFAGRRGRYESPGRLFTSRAFKWTLHRLTKVPLDGGLYVAFDRRVADWLLAYRLAHPFLTPMIAASGFPLASIPVQRSPQPTRRSTYTTWGRVRTAWRGVTTALKCRWGFAQITVGGGHPADSMVPMVVYRRGPGDIAASSPGTKG